MNLVSLLAQRRSQIEVSPEMQEIGKAIAEKYEVPIPNIWLMNRHRVLIEFAFFVIVSEFPKAEVLEALAQEASTLLKARDNRFNPNKHLVIRYKSFMDIKARWIKGSLQMAQGSQE